MAQEKHYEMQWDCQFCGTTKLLGKTHRFCPNCGAPQNPASRYFPPDDEKVAVEDHVFVGADITCPACNQLNAGNSEFCQQCGSPLKDGKRASTLEAQVADESGRFAFTGPRDVTKEKFDAEMERIGVNKKKNNSGGLPKWLPVAAVAAVVLCGFLIWFFTRSVDITVNVTGHEWTRTTYIEQYASFTESSWWDVPVPGDNVVRGLCTSRQRSSRQVYDGETCQTVRIDRGDGTFSEQQQCSPKYRSEPVYDDWCQYSGYRWQPSRELVVKGGLNDTPDWGNANLRCSGQRTVGCERIANQEEVYDLLLKGPEHSYRCPVAPDVWRSVRLETAFTLAVSAIDATSARCDTLKQQ
jgi:hypothetical protein